ncbi:wax ester/triacylglycerol synthase family O-acyltransferase [Mumia sp. zg.B53]|uniref:WS/DGAT/MGAT family O-acyltransferase n=1 Tax=unclassified Mumia TaxID=2621872 RepID=UPI001C6EA1BF|nr:MULTISPECIES: wax ester/triacylglycerol synthase family O-acyltransferase [unclassified Mumia]MBW9204897.1 wax ester/triacylglycerol synthase family O-acyltransferase [Mumia sp. zg.B17]MBW9209099.1 wax ester/triacylglycerol synthase family O-acyltransferase [Mumia sp. zg.B21]MBW9213710.1 wax ester/triacylglycerol synthase family O-acyltransferase [Mumia sp. zg.B53]
MPRRLDALDAAFLDEETSTTPRQVMTLAVIEPGERTFDYDTLVRVVNERIGLVPRYRQRVATVPGHVGPPVWVDDEAFDLTYHVRRSGLPAPGTSAALRELVSRLIARRLDVSRPLWEAYVIEGLEDGRVAVLIKSHQALVDGSVTVDLAQVLLDETPRDRDVPPDGWVPRAGPGSMSLVARSVIDTALSPRRAASRVTAGFDRLQSAVGKVVQTLPVVGPVAADAAGPFNRRLSQHRRYVTVSTRLDDYRLVRDAHGGTVNDVMLSTIAGGIRGWMLNQAMPVSDSTRLRAMVPMSVAAPDGAPTSYGSTVRGHLVSLPVGETNPVVRLHQVSYALKAHRETGVAVAANTLAELPGFAPTTFHAVGARVAETQDHHPYDLVVTNVPGPQEQMFIAGSPIVQTYPGIPLIPGRTLSIGVTSYAGGVYYGMVADRAAVAEPDVLGQCVEDALAELVETASPTRVRAPRGGAPGRRDRAASPGEGSA